MSNCFYRNMSHFGRFRLHGQDAATLLHHLTTNNIKRLQEGAGCDAILITNKARVLDWLQVWREADGFTVFTSPNRRQLFAPHAQKFVLYRQDVQIEDQTDKWAIFGLFGENVRDLLEQWNIASALDAPLNAILPAEIQGVEVSLSRTRRLPHNGLIVFSTDRERLQSLVSSSGVPLCDDAQYNALRIEAGIPVAGLELTEEVNPWEANLDFAISLDKGCYNGQEIVARLHTYRKVKQRLMGLRLEQPLGGAERTALKADGRDGGVLTSSAVSQQFGNIGLGFVRGDFQNEGQVLVAASDPEQRVVVTKLPFAPITD